MLSLKDRVALVTGASRGIGRAISTAYAELGASVALCARTHAALEDVAEEVRAAGGECLVHPVDVGDPDAVDAAVRACTEAFGRLDILVNNAGITRDGLAVRMKDDDWHDVVTVNLSGAFYFTRAASRGMMKQRWGRIINVSSVVGLSGNAGQVNYAASKAGLIGLTKSLAQELGSRGITVNAIAPGFIKTDMTADLDEERMARLLDRIPLGELGEVGDVASAACFLASDAARYITGQVLQVDGGMRL